MTDGWGMGNAWGIDGYGGLQASFASIAAC